MSHLQARQKPLTAPPSYGTGLRLEDANLTSDVKGFHMPKEEWGVKRICPTSGRRFYDLNKSPIASPYTGETVTLDENTKTRVAVAEKVEAKVEDKEPETEEAEDLLVEDEDNADANVDNDLLDDDDGDNVSLDEIADVAAPSDET